MFMDFLFDTIHVRNRCKYELVNVVYLYLNEDYADAIPNIVNYRFVHQTEKNTWLIPIINGGKDDSGKEALIFPCQLISLTHLFSFKRKVNESILDAIRYYLILTIWFHS